MFRMPGAALDDDEAVRLLNHHADQADRRLQVVAHQRREDFALRLDDSHRAHRFVAVLEAFVAGAAVGPGGPFDDAAALALLWLGDPLGSRGHGGQGEARCGNDRAAKSMVKHRGPPALSGKGVRRDTDLYHIC